MLSLNFSRRSPSKTKHAVCCRLQRHPRTSRRRNSRPQPGSRANAHRDATRWKAAHREEWRGRRQRRRQRRRRQQRVFASSTGSFKPQCSNGSPRSERKTRASPCTGRPIFKRSKRNATYRKHPSHDRRRQGDSCRRRRFWTIASANKVAC